MLVARTKQDSQSGHPSELLLASCEIETATAPKMPKSMPREPCRPRIGGATQRRRDARADDEERREPTI
jgi:hypothetical protein